MTTDATEVEEELSTESEVAENRVPAEEKSLWLLSYGIRRYMSFSDRRIVYVVNAAILNLVFLSLSFVAINFFQHKPDLIVYNLWLVAVGLAGWMILTMGNHVASLIFLICGTTICFFFGAHWFQNGAQSLLVVNIVVAIFLIPRATLRWLLATVCGVLFTMTQLEQYQRISNGLQDWRNVTNTILFLLWLALISELFRRLEVRYMALIEERNLRLSKEQARVQSEHVKLLLRTRELRSANRTKEKLLSVVSHDFRTPLANLQMTLDALGRGDISYDEFMELRDSLSHELKTTSHNLDNLLLWSGRQTARGTCISAETSLHGAVHDAVTLLDPSIRMKNLTVSVDVKEDAKVCAELEHLRAIFRNLLSNALKYSPNGGRIEIAAQMQNENWICTVIDSGKGLPKALLGEVKERMSLNSTAGTEGEKGFGLGLEICRGFIAENGGQLWGENTETGRGCFRFSLPSVCKKE